MTASEPKPPTIGFISVVEYNSDYYGGLLVLNTAGRPVEFHCTAPVKPTRSHRVLYGRTLAAFVLADHIGPTMIRNIKSQARLFCTDRIELTEIDAKIAEMIFVPPTENTETENFDSGQDQSQQIRLDSSHLEIAGPQYSKLLTMPVGDQVLAIQQSRQQELESISQQLSPFLQQIDFSEPFERIHNAIRESHGIVDPAETNPDQNEIRA